MKAIYALNAPKIANYIDNIRKRIERLELKILDFD
jgi:hypothetical protein